MQYTNIVNIYGHIVDKSEVILSVGNYNNIHGLLTWLPKENFLEFFGLSEIITPSVIQLILTYEKPLNVISNKTYFSLAVKNTNGDPPNKYLNVNIEKEGDTQIACATISSEKAFFTIDYSSIDKIPRSHILAGALYCLRTTILDKEYIVSWKINGFSNGDLIIFLPTTWYENINSNNTFCQSKNSLINLIENLNQIQFKGYTTQQWCETNPDVINCKDGILCGSCLGNCKDPNHICFPNSNPNSTDNKFICDIPDKEVNMIQSTMVSFVDNNAPQTTGNAATWIAIVIIFLFIIILIFGLTYNYYYK